MDAIASAEPVAPETVSAEEPAGSATDPCAHCGAALARDQRYCLECGAPRTYLSGLRQLDELRAAAPAGWGPPGSAYPPRPAAYEAAAYAYPPPGAPATGASRWGGPASLIAGVGVLLLAMGVGVLIGRAGSNANRTPTVPPAQVITVDQGGAATGSEGTAGESTTPTTGAKKHNAKKAAPKSEASGKAGSGSGVGESIAKPAPPTVLKNEKSKSGGSFEQKSKNLPNVISTG
ncbi:MAG TPA: hypothetical protein VLA79_03640 [Polyangia bacterium]|jgi:hypothetical protein|nr:hypothetical protein [Polyangia bacterium]